MDRFKLVSRLMLAAGAALLLAAPAAWATQGACCYPDGMCVDSVRDDVCFAAGGTKPGGPAGSCSNIACPQPEGGSCSTTADCIPGTGLECVDGTCRTSKMAPAASTAGLLILAAVLAVGGAFAARRKAVSGSLR